MRLSEVSIALLMLVAGCPCEDDECECDDDPFEFEVSGIADLARYYDDELEVEEIAVDATHCSCAEEVTLEFKHRDGVELVPPKPSECLIDATDHRSYRIVMRLGLGENCTLKWAPFDSLPPGAALPIKIRP